MGCGYGNEQGQGEGSGQILIHLRRQRQVSNRDGVTVSDPTRSVTSNAHTPTHLGRIEEDRFGALVGPDMQQFILSELEGLGREEERARDCVEHSKK